MTAVNEIVFCNTDEQLLYTNIGFHYIFAFCHGESFPNRKYTCGCHVHVSAHQATEVIICLQSGAEFNLMNSIFSREEAVCSAEFYSAENRFFAALRSSFNNNIQNLEDYAYKMCILHIKYEKVMIKVMIMIKDMIMIWGGRPATGTPRP